MGNVLRFRSDSDKNCERDIFVAIPCYGGLMPAFVHSLIGACNALERAGMPFTVEMYADNCHVDDSRNFLVRDFLESDCTDLLFLDADMRFESADVMRLLEYEADVVAGAYPIKQPNEAYTARLLNGVARVLPNGLIEVEGAGTGFMRIRRRVLVELAETSVGFVGKGESGRRKIPIIFERTITGEARWGGDYTFCRKWRALGGSVFVAPRMRFEHHGVKAYTGNYGAYLKRASGAHMRDEIEAVRLGTETADTIIDMCQIYGNDSFACMPDMLAAIVHLARAVPSGGNILECGSGLSTLAMAAANPDARVWAFEHDPIWQNALWDQMCFYGLKNINVVRAPLKNYGDFDWYALPSSLPEFDLVIVDGPPRNVARGHRSGVVPTMIAMVKEGAPVVYDDYDEAVAADMARWGGAIHVSGAERKFAITRKLTNKESTQNG